MYENINASYITQHPFFSLGTPASPSLFGQYRATQTAHVTAQNVALPSQVVAALDGDTSLQSQLLRELLGKLPGLIGSAGGMSSTAADTLVAAPAAVGSASPATNAIIAVHHYFFYQVLILRMYDSCISKLLITAICETSQRPSRIARKSVCRSKTSSDCRRPPSGAPTHNDAAFAGNGLRLAVLSPYSVGTETRY